MKDNTVNVNGIEMYLHDINYYADQYIKTELEIDKVNNDNVNIVSSHFVDMILYIADSIQRPGNDDIELLDNIFNIYKRLCTKYSVLPTLECFSFLVKINRATFTDWANGVYRANSTHGITVKKWREECKSFLVNHLQNSKGTDANKIFIAKAAYGMVETAPMQTANIEAIPQLTRAEIAEKYKSFKERPELIELD